LNAKNILFLFLCVTYTYVNNKKYHVKMHNACYPYIAYDWKESNEQTTSVWYMNELQNPNSKKLKHNIYQAVSKST